MRITAQDLFDLKVIDGIIPEPLGGAHRGKESTIDAAGDIITASLRSMKDIDGETLKQERRQKFLDIGRNL